VSIILPTAPANFYTPSLTELKAVLGATNGQTAGQLTLLTAAPDDANNSWAEVGAGNPDLGNARGTLVAGQAPIGFITDPAPAYLEGTTEYGYKLQFAKVNVEVDIDVSSAILVGFALLVGRDTFAEGSNADVRYLARLDNAIIIDPVLNTRTRRHSSNLPGVQSIPVNDKDILELPAWDLVINYAQPLTEDI